MGTLFAITAAKAALLPCISTAWAVPRISDSSSRAWVGKRPLIAGDRETESAHDRHRQPRPRLWTVRGLSRRQLRTKDADILISPNLEAVAVATNVTEQLMDANWVFRVDFHPELTQ